MSNNKKSIDDLFRDRLTNEQANFNPAHWEKMAGLLDKQFVPPAISSGAATTISSAVKLIVISISVSVPALLYVILGTDVFDRKTVNTENLLNIAAVINDSSTNDIESKTNTYNEVLESEKQFVENTKNENTKIITKNESNQQRSESDTKTNLNHNFSKNNNVTFLKNAVGKESQINKKIFRDEANIINYQDIKLSESNVQLTENQSAVTDKQKETILKAEESKTPLNITNADSLLTPVAENSYFPLQKYRGLYAYLGVNYGKSFSNINQKSDYFSPVFGLGFEKSLKKDKYALMLELLYMKSINHSFVKNSISKTYFLDEELTVRNLNTYELEYFRMPLIFKYKLSKHQFLAGIYASYLLNSKSILSESVISQNINQNSSGIVSAYRDGFDDFSYGFIFGYHYSLTKMFDLGFRFNFSPADLSRDSYYLNSEKDNMTEMQFNILWKLY